MLVNTALPEEPLPEAPDTQVTPHPEFAPPEIPMPLSPREAPPPRGFLFPTQNRCEIITISGKGGNNPSAVAAVKAGEVFQRY